MSVAEIEALLDEAQQLFMGSNVVRKTEVLKKLQTVDVKQLNRPLADKVITVRTILEGEVAEQQRDHAEFPLLGLAVLLGFLAHNQGDSPP